MAYVAGWSSALGWAGGDRDDRSVWNRPLAVRRLKAEHRLVEALEQQEKEKQKMNSSI